MILNRGYKGELTSFKISFLFAVYIYKLQGDIGNESLDYFMVNNPKLGRFYLLPKIHKRLQNVPGRPVISNSGYYTENISAFLDHILKPLAKEVKSYIKDTNDFLRKIRSVNLPSNAILATIDVVGLYPNIPHDEGLIALENALNGRKDKEISTKSVLELAECVLKNNIFEHDGRVFLQKQGTAIGTKMAPSYAILFMAELEEKILNTCQKSPCIWWRYIDDIFMVWEHGEDSLQDFLSFLNSFHDSIKFTAKYSAETVEFLDVQVIVEGGKLATDLFVKETDTHQYLEASSCHPYHCMKAIPYSQAMRLNRICSDSGKFDQRCNELEQWLARRGYKESLVRSQILRARKLSRDSLLDGEGNGKKASGFKLVLNVTYHPAFKGIRDILNKVHLLLTHDGEHQKVFTEVPIVGFKRGKSLQDMLVRARLRELQQEGESAKCHGKRCGVCEYVVETDKFQDKNGQETFHIKTNKIHCNSINVIYLVQCKNCNIQYVGSTSTKFRLRFNNYKACHRKFLLGKVVPQHSFHEHFNQLGHSGMEDWSFTFIDKVDDLNLLRKREAFWQLKLDSFSPNGLNEREVTFEF